jgi:hypothetical protein
MEMLEEIALRRGPRPQTRAELEGWVFVRDGVFKPPSPSQPQPKPRGKLSDAAWEKHLDQHPIGKTHPTGGPLEGRPVGAPWRTERLKVEQGITVDRSVVSKRLKETRKQSA